MVAPQFVEVVSVSLTNDYTSFQLSFGVLPQLLVLVRLSLLAQRVIKVDDRVEVFDPSVTCVRIVGPQVKTSLFRDYRKYQVVNFLR